MTSVMRSAAGALPTMPRSRSSCEMPFLAIGVTAFVTAFSVGAWQTVSFFGELLTIPVREKPGHEIAFLGPVLLVAGAGFEPATFGL